MYMCINVLVMKKNGKSFLKYTFGQRLKTLRESKNISQEQLAWGSGLDQTTVWRIENGITDPRFTTICQMAEILEVDAGELVKLK